MLWGITLLCLFSCNGLVEKLNDQPELDDFVRNFEITNPCSLSRDVDESYKFKIENPSGTTRLYIKNFANRGENLSIRAYYRNGTLSFSRNISGWGYLSGEMRLRPPLFNVIDVEYTLDERSCTEKGNVFF